MTNPSIPVENQEQNESNNKIKKEDLSYFNELSRKCARKKISWNESLEVVKDITFLEDFNSKKYDKNKFFNDFKNILSWEDLKKVLLLNEEQKNKLFEDFFSREINKIWVPFDRKRNDLNEIISKKYTVNQAWKLNLDQAIKKLDSETLDKYIFYPEELEVFVKSILKTVEWKTSNFKEVKKIFENFSFKSASEFQTIIEEKITQNPDLWTKEEVISSLYWILNTIKSLEKIDSIDIRNLFNFGIFNDEQKKEFLKTFLPSISLQELVNLDIVNKDEANETKKEELTNYLKKKRNITSIEEDDTELKNLIEDLDIKDIFVSTQKYIDSHIVKLEKSELFAENVAKSVNKTVEEIKDKINAEIQTPEILQKRIMEDSALMRKLVWWKGDLEKLKTWVIFRFKALKEDNSQFYEVINLADNWNFSWKNRSLDWKYNSSSEVNTENKNYKDLYELLSSDKLKEFELITKDEIKSKIESWNIEEIKDELWEPWKLELSNYSKKIDEKIEKIKFWKSEEEYKKDEEYIKLMEIKERLSKEDALSDNIVKEELNQFTLESKIDEKDPSWKEFWVKVWVSFKFTEWDDKEYRVYTISHLDQLWKKIEIINPIWVVEKMTFDQFYKWFKSKNWKVTRFTGNTLFTWLIDNLTKDPKISSSWSNFEVKDGNIMKKKQENVTYPYLVQKQKELWKQNKFIKIFDTVWAWVNQRIWISFWEIKGSEKEWDEIYEISNKKEYVTIAFLENYIKTLELKPKTDQKETLIDDETVIKQWKKPRWWFFKWYLSNKSVFEIMSWLKMWFDQFKNHLKSWNEEHSAKVALATWGKFLPTEVKTELKSRVESAEKKHMDDAVWRLKAVDTPDAIDLIYRRLNFKNTEEYKKEAALIFMLEKYWNLYNKNYDGKGGKPLAPLNSRKWEFLWFKALSWYRWDVTKHPLYIETKKSCETPDKDWRTRNFTEEELVWMLMKKQCSLHWYNWVHRRSRLHKEVEKLKKEWLKTEIEDWYKKGNDTRNPSDQLRKWIWEIKDWSPANGIWRFKKLVDRWDDMTTMNTIPMVLIYSWVANTLPDDLCDAVKGMIDEWRVIPIARFMSYPWDIKLAMKTIRILANKIQERSPNYKTIWDEANELYEDFVTGRISERERVEKTLKFFQDKKWKTWKTYGQILTRAMYMSADWEYDDDSDINSLLLTEKDKPWEDGQVLTNYFKKQHAYIWNMAIKDGYFSDSFLWRWLSSVWVKVISETLKAHSWWAFNMPDSWAWMVEEIKNEIEATKKRKYKNEEDRRTWLNYYLRNFFAWLVESAQTKPDGINSLFKWVGSFRFFADNRWITFDKVIKAELSKDDILEWNKWDKLFNKFVSNIIENKWWWNVSDNIFSIIENKKEEY